MKTEAILYKGRNSVLSLHEDPISKDKILVKSISGTTDIPRASITLMNEYDILRDQLFDGVRKVVKLEKGKDGNRLFLEYIEGDTLSMFLTENNIGLVQLLDIIIQCCDILCSIHEAGIIHKDINPGNIIIRKSDGKVFLIDFGISGKINLKLENQANPETLEGTLFYIAPEQTGRMDRMVDQRADLYSLGVTFYEKLTGSKPFNGQTPLEFVHAHLAQKPVHPSNPALKQGNRDFDIPEIIGNIILQLMAKDPKDRYKSASGLKHDLEICKSQLEVSGNVADFQLKEKDFSGQLFIPERLYGMEGQLNVLRKCFDSICEGSSEFILVTGTSGVGKSALIRSFNQHLSGVNGLMAIGKFDQLNRSVPFSAFSVAFSSVVRALLSENKDVLNAWKNKFLNICGGLGQVLIQVVPDLEKIIGPQPAAPVLSTTEAQNRLEFLLKEFVKCLADISHPLILFIDDLQWADEASLRLMKMLVSGNEITGLLFIGSYRNNEVDATHPLQMTLNETALVKKATLIPLDNMKQEALLELLSDTFNLKSSEVTGLANEIYSKTRGNAFHVIQFIKTAYREGTIFFDSKKQLWTWDLAGIKKMGYSENVVDLLTSRMHQFSSETTDALKMAACIGNRFNTDYLSAITGFPVFNLLKALEPSVKEGYIVPMETDSWNLIDESVLSGNWFFRFAHDRIQQAAYSLISENDRPGVHLKVGRLLLKNLSDQESGSQIFDVVSHMNMGVNLIQESEEKLRLAALNAKAGYRARISSAYGQALIYLEQGISLVGSDSWNTHYDLTLDLYLNMAECAYLNGDFNLMEEVIPKVLGNARNILDKIPVYNTMVDAYTASHDLPKAITAGLEALNGLGVKFPSKPKMVHIFKGLGATKMKLAGKKVESLADNKEMTDPYMLQAMPLMERISPAAYMSGSHLFPLLVFRMVDLSVKYGNSPQAAFAYSSFAITLSGVLGDYDGGYRFANLSLSLLEKYHDEVYKVKVYFVNYCFIRHWKEHASNMVAPLFEAYRSGLKAGNLFSGTWVACYALTWKFFTAQPLDTLKSEVEQFIHTFQQLKQFGAFNFADILHQTICRLTEDGAPENESNDEQILKRSSEAHDKTAVFFLYLNRMIQCYLEGELQKARTYAAEAKPLLEAVTGLHYIPQYYFYHSLILLADPTSGAKDIKHAQAGIKKMRTWAKHAPMNFKHKLHLLEALFASRSGKTEEAKKSFDTALAGARENGYVQEEAMILECAHHFYSQLQIDHLSRYYRQEMIRAYSQWGAWSKLKRLGVDENRKVTGSQAHTKLTTFTQTAAGSISLDFESIQKATLTLSEEKDTRQLLKRFMNIMVENSGADKGVLLLRDKEKLSISARVSANSGNAELIEAELISETTLPNMVMNAVVNGKEVIVQNDTSRDYAYKKDNYFMSTPPKAFICLPLLNKSNLVGLVYFENAQLPDVFNEQRTEVMRILGAQFAVALDNLRLYEHTRNLNKAYERFVPKQFLGFLNKESITDVSLGDHIQREMTILFLDIRSFTRLSEQMTPSENFHFINEFLGIMEPVVRKHGGFIDKYIGDAIMALFPDSTDQAIEAGNAMLRELVQFNKTREANGKEKVAIGLGMHTGELMLGTIGGSERMDTTVISDAVNVASRIERLNKQYRTSFLVTDATIDRLQAAGSVYKRKIGEVPIRGKVKPITLYEIFNASDSDEIRTAKINGMKEFDKAVAVLGNGGKEEAAVLFEEILKNNPMDLVAAGLLEQCRSNISGEEKH